MVTFIITMYALGISALVLLSVFYYRQVLRPVKTEMLAGKFCKRADVLFAKIKEAGTVEDCRRIASNLHILNRVYCNRINPQIFNSVADELAGKLDSRLQRVLTMRDLRMKHRRVELGRLTVDDLLTDTL